MAQQTINNGDAGLDARTKINTNFLELYTGKIGTATAGTNITWTVNSNGISISNLEWLTTARASNDGIGLNTAQTNVTWTVNSAGISLNAGGYAGTGTALNLTNLTGTLSANTAGVSLSLSAGAGGAAPAASAANGSFSFQTVSFSNLNGISFGTSAGSAITASHNGLTTARASNDGAGLNTAATNVTWTVNSAGISLNAGGYAGTGTSATNASITLNSNGLAISVAAPGGGGAMTVSQFPLMPLPLATSSAYSGATNTTAGGSRTTVSLYVAPFVVNHPVSFNSAHAFLSHATVAGTGSLTYGNAFGLYTLNVNTLSFVSSFGFGFNMSQNSVTARSHYWYWGSNSTSNSSSNGGNFSASVARLNQVPYYNSTAQSLAAGEYWLAYGATMRSSGAAVGSFSAMHVSQSQSTGGSIFGTNASSRNWPAIGIYSFNTTNTRSNNVADILPVSIAVANITGTGGSSQNRSNVIFFMTNI